MAEPTRPPFTPGYGAPPEVLVGRDDLMASLKRSLTSGATVHHALYGPRGVGTTALLSELATWAVEEQGWHVVRHRLSEEQDITSTLVDRLTDPAKAMNSRWRRLAEDLRSNLTVELHGPVSLTKDLDPARSVGPADTLLERALVQLGDDAASAGTSVVLLLDEFHSPRPGRELLRLSHAMQGVFEEQLPVHVLAAGLRPPEATHTRGATFLERLPSSRLGLLGPDATRLGLLEPLANRGVEIHSAALDALTNAAHGYPYFIQLFGARTWDAWLARGGQRPITTELAGEGIAAARDEVDTMYRGRFEQLSPTARRFVVVMAELGGDDPVEMQQVAERMGRERRSLSTVRETLVDRHQLIEPVARGVLRFQLPWYGEWLNTVELSPLGVESPSWLGLEP